jgi:predicted amidophosphoribosyltransferase
MESKKVITICLNCQKITETIQEYDEDLVTANFCPECIDEANEDVYIRFYKEFEPED